MVISHFSGKLFKNGQVNVSRPADFVGEVREQHADETDCWACRIVGTSLFYGIAGYSVAEACRSSARNPSRRFFALNSVLWAILGTYRMITPARPFLKEDSSRLN
jgi:hypothetical protein